MRAMANPWGTTFVVVAAVLTLLLEASVIAVLVALAIYLVRRSRPGSPHSSQLG